MPIGPKARIARLSRIAGEIRTCTRCGLHLSRRKAVPGEGPATARIMLVGEAPGREEDLRGRPFVSRSGGILEEILRAVGLGREELFITSVVKCRPPRNRLPLREEWETCVEVHLRRQIKVVLPEIVCLLGGVAAKALLNKGRVSEIRGRAVRQGGLLFFPTYHPAAAGRSRAWFRALSNDMAKLKAMMERDLLQRKTPGPEDQPQ